MVREFNHTRQEVYNRGGAPENFLNFIVDWALDTPSQLFQYNDNADVYSHVRYKLGPWKEGDDFLTHRKAVMLEVLRTLCGFESSWNWEEDYDQSANEGYPTDRHIKEWEAGILQSSSDSLNTYQSCSQYAAALGIGVNDHTAFRMLSMQKGAFPIHYGVLILRETYMHHGPLLRTENNTADSQESSLHPYLSKACVAEFENLLRN